MIMQKGVDKITLQKITNCMSFIERLRLKLKKPVKIGDYELNRWTGKLPFYLFKCIEHGYVISYPSGYSTHLVCPLCIGNEEQSLDKLLDTEIEVQEPIIDSHAL